MRPLRLGDTEFLCAAGGKLAFARKCESGEVRIYVNQSEEMWTLPQGKVLYSQKLCDGVLAPMGFCVQEA